MTKRGNHLNIFTALRIHLMACCCLLTTTAAAQENYNETKTFTVPQQASLAKTWELGLLLGSSNYSGTLTPRLLDKTQFQWSAGIYGQYNINNRFSVRSAFVYARISGSDINDPEYGRRLRSANFRSDIYEWSFTGQLHLLPYGTGLGKIFVPSIFAGIAVFHINPEARIFTGLDANNGDPMYLASSDGGKTFFNTASANAHYVWVPLQPVGTEGQTAHKIDTDPQYPPRHAPNQYKLWQASIPFGLDLDFIVNSSWTVGVEAGLRATFTGYLDDINGYYFDRKDYMQQIVDANPIIYGYVNGKKVVLPNTIDFSDQHLNPNSLSTAVLLSDPSLIAAVNIDPNTGKQIVNPYINDANTYPNGRKGNFKNDWYCIFNIKVSKVFGYNRVARNATKQEEKNLIF